MTHHSVPAREDQGFMREITSYALAYALWAVTTVLGVFVGFGVQSATMTAITIASLPAYQSSARNQFYIGLQIRAVEPWTYLILGLLVVILLVFTEAFYRLAVPSGKLLKRFFLMTAIELGILFLANVIRWAMSMSMGTTSWSGVIMPVIELAATGIFVWLYQSQVKATAQR